MLCIQPKRKSIVTTMALQCVKTIEAAMIKEIVNCDLELIQLLIISNLAMTALLVLIKIKKSRLF